MPHVARQFSATSPSASCFLNPHATPFTRGRKYGAPIQLFMHHVPKVTATAPAAEGFSTTHTVVYTPGCRTALMTLTTAPVTTLITALMRTRCVAGA